MFVPLVGRNIAYEAVTCKKEKSFSSSQNLCNKQMCDLTFGTTLVKR